MKQLFGVRRQSEAATALSIHYREKTDLKRCRAALATALQIFVAVKSK